MRRVSGAQQTREPTAARSETTPVDGRTQAFQAAESEFDFGERSLGERERGLREVVRLRVLVEIGAPLRSV